MGHGTQKHRTRLTFHSVHASLSALPSRLPTSVRVPLFIIRFATRFRRPTSRGGIASRSASASVVRTSHGPLISDLAGARHPCFRPAHAPVATTHGANNFGAPPSALSFMAPLRTFGCIQQLSSRRCCPRLGILSLRVPPSPCRRHAQHGRVQLPAVSLPPPPSSSFQLVPHDHVRLPAF